MNITVGIQQETIQSRKHRLRWWTLLVLSVSLVLIAVDTTILNVAIPTLQQDLGASASGLQWIVSSYILVFAGLLLTMGFLGDRFGRKRLLQSGMIVFALSSLAAAYAQSTGQLIAARALMGVGGAMIMPATLSIIIDVFPREERAKAIGIWSAVAGIGVPLGMIVGGWMLESLWWGSVFLINIPIGATVLAAGFFLVPDSRDPKPWKIDLPGAILSTGALSVLLYAIIEAPARGWLEPLVLAGFAVSLVGGIAFVLYELRSNHPMLDVRLFKNARLSTGAIGISFAFLALLGMVFLFTQYLQFVRDYSPLQAGLRMVPLALGFMVGGGSSSVLSSKLGTRTTVTAGLVIIGAALVSLAFLDLTTAYWLISIELIALGFGMGITMAPATDAVMDSVPEANAGVGSALNDVTRNVGGAIGVGVLGSIFTSVYSSSVANAVVSLPAEVAEAAQNSIGAAFQIAANVGGTAGESLVASANGAFIDGLGIAMAVSAAIAFIGALLVVRFMPGTRRAESRETEFSFNRAVPTTVPIHIDD